MFKYAVSAILLACLIGCAGCQTPLNPGADPVVVRTEQAQTIALSTFRTFLKVEDSNRSFFKTNAPALHEFAEYLRYKTPNGDRRYVAYLRSLDKIKLDYKAGRASSNEVVQVLGVVQSTLDQVVKYQSEIITKGN